MTDTVKMRHPKLDQEDQELNRERDVEEYPVTVTRDAFDHAWKALGWEEVQTAEGATEVATGENVVTEDALADQTATSGRKGR